jgi:hypothetical protein
MRMSFKQFMMSELTNKTPALGASLYGADARHDIWGLPSLHTAGLATHHLPPGGFNNLGQMAQFHQNNVRFQDEDYVISQTLEKVAALAENSVEGIKNKHSGLKASGHYQYAKFNLGNGVPPSDPSVTPGWIIGLQENDIISGLYPRLKHEELARAREIGVIIETPGRGFDLNVNLLRQMMHEYQHKIASKEQSFHGMHHLAGTVDAKLGQAFAPVKSDNLSVNPWAAT